MVKENKSERQESLIEFKKIGFGKTGYIISQFVIDKDYQVYVTMNSMIETSSLCLCTDKEALNDGEVNLVDSFIEHILIPKKKELSTIYVDDSSKYEEESLLFQDVVITEDYDVFHRFQLLKTFLQDNHNNISCDILSQMYSRLEENTNYKKKNKRI